MKRSAFTLVELLIVVVILGILAAVVIPQFSDASTDAKFSSLGTNLSTIRGQIELYKLQHGGTYPLQAKFEAMMTAKTDASGNSGGTLGPYLQRVPNNPYNNLNTVGVPTATAGSTGWKYDETTGDFRANDGGTTNTIAHDTL
ncbi:MAG TPA: prepilin-type N-terminal cleavage/methylation domain-containing protein [Phycisphaerae bacterium]|nr:prepilin-type N-terminal cleavage/methylation domain-containing protein [Phycisphaerae bacterium]HRW53695.1 prepilin-type N-terminal cleavage/methylation domain-containing protein [Phycisphaerae bacterium]